MNILLASDGSEYADEAARFLAKLPHKEPLKLSVLTVVDVPEIHGTMETRRYMENLAEAARKDTANSFERVAAIFSGANAELEHVIAEGHAAETIVAKAEELQPELVVLGAQGHSTLERIMLGSVSDFVATHAPCSVLVVRPQENALVAESLRVCLPYDDSKPSKKAIEALISFGWGEHTYFDLVNIVSFVNAYVSEVPIEIDMTAVKDALEDMVKVAAEPIRKLSPHVHACVHEASHIGHGITSFAEDQASNLIVMGDTGRSMLGRFLLGSVSRYVLRHAHCSVWIVR